MCRLTYVGRGLKSESLVIFKEILCRLTYVGRGLKFSADKFEGGVAVSPHIRGARIEMSLSTRFMKSPTVASHTWGED